MVLSKNYYPVIKKVNFSQFDNSIFDNLDENEQSLLTDFPVVYIIYNPKKSKISFTVYVGETTNIIRRTKQHLTDDIRNGRQDWIELGHSKESEMYVIGHRYFNKSLTLDIENRLMHYLSSSPAVQSVYNRRSNEQGDYFTSEVLDDVFSKIWRKLHKKNSIIFPLESIIKDSVLFKASPFHKLTKEQLEAKSKITLNILSCLSQNEKGQLILVEGEAGSGKTVLMSNLLYDIINSDDFHKNLSVCLLVNHKQQLIVYEQLSKKLGLSNIDGTEIVQKPTSFINKGRRANIVIIDEAHLLLTRGKQSYRGKNHLKDILALADVVVAIFDQNQILLTEQIWEGHQLAELKLDAKINIILENQMRMHSSPNTIKWIKDLVYKKEVNELHHDPEYDIKIFNNPKEMYQAILEKSKDESRGISRILATFDWPFKNKPKEDGSTWNVTVGDFSLPWNLQVKANKRATKDLSWAEQEQTIGEVGSTFTIQGFDLNYSAVIIGPSVKYRDGRIVYDSSCSKNTNVTSRRTLENGEKVSFSEELLMNELNVLLTRGVYGLYLYAVDEQLQEALKKAVKNINNT